MIYLYGASGHAKVIVDILKSTNKRIAGVFDDDTSLKKFLDLKVLGLFDYSLFTNDSKLIISIGDNLIRKSIANKLNINYHTAVHKSTVVSNSASIGFGSVVMANCVINSNAVVGNHCIINSSSVIEHDCTLDDFVHISPNATLTGNIHVGEGSHIGAGVTILPNLSIGKWCKIGAGAVVLNDLPDNCVAVGNPAKIIKSKT